MFFFRGYVEGVKLGLKYRDVAFTLMLCEAVAGILLKVDERVVIFLCFFFWELISVVNNKFLSKVRLYQVSFL